MGFLLGQGGISPSAEELQGTVFQGLGPAWGRCSFSLSATLLGEAGGVCRAGRQQACIPSRDGAGEEARGCSWTRPPRQECAW